VELLAADPNCREVNPVEGSILWLERRAKKAKAKPKPKP
jgi:hypothetical protein